MCCCTPITIRKQRKIPGDLIVVVLHRESMRLDRLHEQAITRTFPQHELVQLCLTIKVLFKLLLQQTTGMVASLQKMADLDCARIHDTLPTAEDLGRPDPVSSPPMAPMTPAGSHTAIVDRQATAIFPIRKNGRPWKEDVPADRARNEALRATRHYGPAFWKRWNGYHARSRIEAKMRGLKAFGERVAARVPDHQTAEIQIRVALMNCFSALGATEIVRVA